MVLAVRISDEETDEQEEGTNRQAKVRKLRNGGDQLESMVQYRNDNRIENKSALQGRQHS